MLSSDVFMVFWVVLSVAFIVFPMVVWLVVQTKKHEQTGDTHEEKTLRKWDSVVAKLLADPDNEELLMSALNFLQANRNFSEVGYRMALDLIVTTKAASQNKVFALRIGRLHYSSSRPDGQPTIYDEAAIENDIRARC
ncbi:hypothetical protein OAH34_02825 [bacterium]|nr:hypothetical protein [bacterium]